MRNLGEQWVEDGHMWKVVPNGSCDGCDFNLGCMRNGGVICRSGHCATKQGHVKDLGPVNEDGLLGCPFCGEYPVVQPENSRAGFGCHCDKCKCAVSGLHESMQEVMDEWNRRA